MIINQLIFLKYTKSILKMQKKKSVEQEKKNLKILFLEEAKEL